MTTVRSDIDPKPLLEILAKANDKAAVDIAKAMMPVAKSLVPVNSGETRDGIHIRKSDYEGGGAALVAEGKDISVKGRLVPLVFLIEYGKKFRPAKPFMRPALEVGRRISKRMFERRIAGKLK